MQKWVGGPGKEATEVVQEPLGSRVVARAVDIRAVNKDAVYPVEGLWQLVAAVIDIECNQNIQSYYCVDARAGSVGVGLVCALAGYICL